MTAIKQLFPDLAYKDISTFTLNTRISAPVIAGSFTFDDAVGLAIRSMSKRAYIIDSISFSSNVNSLDFTEALDPTVNNGFFSLNVVKGDSAERISKTPLDFTGLNQNVPLNLLYTSQERSGADLKQDINFQLRGQALQTPALVAKGISQLDIYISTIVYEVGKAEWLMKNWTA